MDSIKANKIQEIIDHPYDCKPIECKWLFKKKLGPNDTIKKYKDMLMAKEYTYKEGDNYFGTYSPVARMTTIQILLSLVASYGLKVHQIDVKITFINGELDEEIYLDQPKGFVIPR